MNSLTGRRTGHRHVVGCRIVSDVHSLPDMSRNNAVRDNHPPPRNSIPRVLIIGPSLPVRHRYSRPLLRTHASTEKEKKI